MSELFGLDANKIGQRKALLDETISVVTLDDDEPGGVAELTLVARRRPRRGGLRTATSRKSSFFSPTRTPIERPHIDASLAPDRISLRRLDRTTAPPKGQ